MIYTELDIPGVFTVDLEERSDDRGFFARSYCADEFAARGLVHEMVQSNLSFNHVAGTVRGMHMQKEPHGEVKLVRATRGSIIDVIVDMRPESPTHLHHVAVELTEENRRALYVPIGFAHGYQTLTDRTEVLYQVSARYAPGFEQGYRFDDPAFGIVWPLPARVISEKDASWPTLVTTEPTARS